MSHSTKPVDHKLGEQVEAVRRFSRFYTRTIGVLQDGFLGSPLSLTEGRVIYELGQGPAVAAGLAEMLDLDPGYLSRMLRSFEDQKLISRRPAEHDGRQSVVALTFAGRKLFHTIDQRSAEEIGALIAPMADLDRERLVGAMRTVEAIVAPTAKRQAVRLRDPLPGDLGWVTHRHGVLYHREYGFDQTFEALVAEICAKFVTNFDSAKEKCWIAETDDGIAGSVFIVRQSDAIAKLRLLYVEPGARGLGVGRRLVDEAIGFARERGYETLALWTNDCLDAACHIYRQAGFCLVAEEPHTSFGCTLVGQNWELQLSDMAAPPTRRIPK